MKLASVKQASGCFQCCHTHDANSAVTAKVIFLGRKVNKYFWVISSLDEHNGEPYSTDHTDAGSGI